MPKKQSLTQSVPGIWHMFKYVSPYLKPQRALLAGSFGAMFVSVLMHALEPWPLKVVIDNVIVPDAGNSAGSSWISSLPAMTIVALSATALVVIMCLRALAVYWQKVGFALVGNRVMTQIRAALYRHIQCLSLSFHNKSKSGDLIVRVIGDVGLLKDISVTALMPLLGSLMVLSLMTGLMFWLNWQLALVVLAMAPIYWLPTRTFGRRIQRASREQRQRESAIASAAVESIGAMQVVQTLSLENTFAGQFGKYNQKSLKEGVKIRRLLAKLEGSVQVMTGVSTAVVLFAGSFLILRGSLSAGELLVFLSYLKAVMKPLRDFSKYSGRIAKASAAGERVIQIFETPADVTDSQDAQPAPAFRGAVTFDRVCYGYTPGHAILKDVSFDIKAGQKVAIVGPSGSGKSTLIGLLSRLYDPDGGRILIDGCDIRQFTLESLRTQVSVVLQDTLLFATSIEDNIAYGAPGSSAEQIRVAARLANIHTFIESLPDKYETRVGERGVTLSVGQRQRISLARAALRKAPLLILDEATSSLDMENRRAVMNALHKIGADRTTIMITHDLSEIEHADLIVHMRDGEVIERGTHQDLIALEGSYARLINREILQQEHVA